MPGPGASVSQISGFLDSFAPPALAEDWDNVGLLLGDPDARARRVMTCLTLTGDVAREAVERGAGLVVTHHPVLFRPVQRLTTQSPEGSVLLTLAAGGVAVYSPHTAFDSAAGGINQQLALALGLDAIEPLRPRPFAGGEAVAQAGRAGAGPEPVGGGRHGRLSKPMTLREFMDRVRSSLGVAHLQFVGEADRVVSRAAVACGSAAEFIHDAVAHGCDVLLTGEARFHACLEARDRGLDLVLAGHYATERPAVEALAATLSAAFPELEVWASEQETDPINWCISS